MKGLIADCDGCKRGHHVFHVASVSGKNKALHSGVRGGGAVEVCLVRGWGREARGAYMTVHVGDRCAVVNGPAALRKLMDGIAATLTHGKRHPRGKASR